MSDTKGKVNIQATRDSDAPITNDYVRAISNMRGLAEAYTKMGMSMFANAGKGLVEPSTDMFTNEAVQGYSKKQMGRLLDAQAMLFAGLYSMAATGDSSAFMNALAMKSKTIDDLDNFKNSWDVIRNPNSSRDAKLASAAYMQSEFGIDPGKHYNHLNQAALQTDALNIEIGKALMQQGIQMDENITRTFMASSKIANEEFASGTDMDRISNAMANITALMSSDMFKDDKTMQGKFRENLTMLSEKLTLASQLPISSKDTK